MTNKSITIIFFLVLISLSCSQNCQSSCQACSNSTCTSCYSNFTLSSGICIPCPPNCQTCNGTNITNTVCTACYSGYTLSSDGLRCFICSELCTSCSQYAENCVGCTVGTLYNITNTSYSFCAARSSCSDPCTTCDQYGNCASCQIGTSIIGISCRFSCTGGLAFNGACSTSTSCISPYVLDSYYGQCWANSYYCLTSNGGFCKQCPYGTYLYNSQIFYSCNYPTVNCSSNTTSLVCSLTTYLVGGQCIYCYSGCLSCLSANTNCLTCRWPYSYNANSSGVCFRCTSIFCLTCIQSSPSTCIQCVSGSTLVNQSCVQCPAYCLSCYYNSNQLQCLTCTSRNTLINGLCVNCGQYCLQCSTFNQSICIHCDVGYYNEGGKCYLCMYGCALCANSYICQVAKQGYGVNVYSSNTVNQLTNEYVFSPAYNGQNIAIDTAVKCQEGAGIQYGLYCLLCSWGCVNCLNNTYCTTCSQRFYNVGGQCQGCSNSNCLECQPGNLTYCLTCINGYTISSISPGSCVQCPSNCVYCDQNNTSICYQAAIGYAAHPNGKIIKCLANCGGKCDPANVSVCLGCPNGLQLLNGVCVLCPSGCRNCQGGLCYLCDYRYEMKNINGTTGCYFRCPKFCTSCNETTCLTWSSSCTVNVTANTCLLVNSPGPTCSSGNGANCFYCQVGYYSTTLNGTFTCVACPVGCWKCSSASFCNICNRGYVQQIIYDYDMWNSSLCIACSSPCLYCIDYPTVCTACVSGYILSKNVCENTLRINFTYYMNYVYGDFLSNGNISDIQSALIAALNITLNQLFIYGIVSGSVGITVAVVPDPTLNQTQQNASLTMLTAAIPQALQSTPNLLTYTISLSNQTINYTAPANNSSNSSNSSNNSNSNNSNNVNNSSNNGNSNSNNGNSNSGNSGGSSSSNTYGSTTGLGVNYIIIIVVLSAFGGLAIIALIVYFLFCKKSPANSQIAHQGEVAKIEPIHLRQLNEGMQFPNNQKKSRDTKRVQTEIQQSNNNSLLQILQSNKSRYPTDQHQLLKQEDKKIKVKQAY